MTEATNKKSTWVFGIGCLLLLPLTIYLQYQWGYSLGYEGAALAGYSTGAMFWLLIVVGITALFKKARNLRSLLIAAFVTLVLMSFITLPSWLRNHASLDDYAVGVDPASYDVDARQAEALGRQIQAAVQRGQTEKITQLMNYQRLVQKALAGQKVTPRLRDFANGVARGLGESPVFDQFARQVQQGATFQFVKYFRKKDRPFLQYRFVNSFGGLSYLGLYLYKKSAGELGIEDLLIYESGASVAEQVITQAQAWRDAPPAENLNAEKEKLQELRQLMQEGKTAEALQFIEALPPVFQRLKYLRQAKVQLTYEVDPVRADGLFAEYRQAYPQDLSVVFLRFNAHLAKNEFAHANTMIDEIYEAVDRDDYLLWHTARIFAATPDPQATIALLTKMEMPYQINVRQSATLYLPAAFLSSKEYKRWANRPSVGAVRGN